MSRTLTSKNAGEVTKQVTRPVFFIALGFGSPLRLSSRETQTISGTTYTAAGLKVDLSSGMVSLFNEAFQFSATFLAGVAGVTAAIYQGYGPGPFASSDLDQVFDGEIAGVSSIGTNIIFTVRRAAPLYTPRIVVGPPTFNYLFSKNAIFQTPTGTYP